MSEQTTDAAMKAEEDVKAEAKVETKVEDAKAEEVKPEDAKPAAEESKPESQDPAEEGKYTTNEEGQRVNIMKNRKVALYLGYYGAAYQGMQRNPGAHTIEDVLEKAIHKAGGISDDNFGDLTKVSWMRAARTDKGVSAACNVVSLKMVLEPEGVVERINDNLPDDIRVFGYFRVTGGFCSRKLCDCRRYGYLLPLWALDPNHSVETKKRQKTTENGESGDGAAAEEARASDEKALVARFGDILKQYQGTHNFHSFTKGKEWSEPQSKRYIMSWTVETFVVKGRTYVKCEVLGQSYLYHQIRKMRQMEEHKDRPNIVETLFP